MAKRRFVGWVPAIILSAGIIAVAVTASVLVSNGLGAPAPKPTNGQVTDLNWSIFTDEGLAYIRSTRDVRIDLSKPPVAAEPLGLEDDATLVLEPIDNLDTTLDYSLIVNGGIGGDKFIVSQITIVTEHGVVTHVTAPLSDVLNFRQTLDVMLGEADQWGWDVSGVDEIFQRVEDATRAGTPYEFSFGPGDKAGVPVTATAYCDPTGFCVLEYDAAPSVR